MESDTSDIVDDLELLQKRDDNVDVNEVPHPQTEGDFVLVLFASKSNTYYVGKVIKDVDDDGDCDVSFYRISSKAKDSFVLPNVPDLCSVHISDIKKIIPKPSTHAAQTKRQQSYIGFDFNFDKFKMG